MNAQTFEHLTVKPIDKKLAKKIVVEKHYSHKWNTAFGTNCFGIFLGDILCGVAVYGYPMNPKSWGSITSLDSKFCIELNRLWVDDCLGKNTETWFLAKTFSILREREFRLIQSFADGRLGVGTIYQASNFIYTGYHKTLFFHTKENEMMHGSMFTNSRRARAMIWRNCLFADGQLNAYEIKTYRYLYPLDKNSKKSIKLKSLPYPKERDGIKEVLNYLPPASQIARAAIIAKVCGQIENEKKLINYLETLTDDSQRFLEIAMSNSFIQTFKKRIEGTSSYQMEPLF